MDGPDSRKVIVVIVVGDVTGTKFIRLMTNYKFSAQLLGEWLERRKKFLLQWQNVDCSFF